VDDFSARLRHRAAETLSRDTGGVRLTCGHVPRELIEAFGIEAPRLIPPGTVSSESRGENRSGPGACAWCKSALGSVEAEHPWIGAATCDQMRRTIELAGRSSGHPPSVIHFPKTRTAEAEAFYLSELKWLADEMARRTGRPSSAEDLRRIIEARNEIRARIRVIRAGLSGGDFAALIHLEASLPAAEMLEFLAGFEAPPDRREGLPVLTAGSPLMPADGAWLDLLEESGLAVVADATCTGDRAIDFEIAAGPEDDPLEALARGHFRRPPCLFVRPNDEFYSYAGRLTRERGVRAIVWRSLRGCDIHGLEPPRARQILGLPLLAVDTNCGDAASMRVRTRVEAFAESLR
jgi:benzoyl-CoA reductase/2-hydroxyglutaryl-CoA dehydratase subunit BcrC/BadD/HgdB